MTYGDNAAQVRAAMTTLLRQHRIQQRLGGATANSPETTSVDERRAMGEQVRRYRHGVLTWCLQAMDATNPDRLRFSSRGSVDDLHHRLQAALLNSTAGLPPLAELTTAHRVMMVETWRHAARAACVGEHDFAAGVRAGPLSRAECAPVIGDVAAITEAVAVLDLRYKNTPGWEHLHRRGSLAAAAANCADLVRQDDRDRAVDSTGWRPRPGIVEGPAGSGLVGVLQAEHNLLLALSRFPNALNLRRVLNSQRILSGGASGLARRFEPGLAMRWGRRADTYTALVHYTRNLGGLVGDGGVAAAEGANAVTRMRRMAPGHDELPRQLRHLDRLFTHVDAELTAVVEHGTSHGFYLVRKPLPELADHTENLIVPAQVHYVPITAPERGELLRVLRHRLRVQAPDHAIANEQDRGGRERPWSAPAHPPSGGQGL